MKVLGALDNAVLINCPVDRATYVLGIKPFLQSSC